MASLLNVPHRLSPLIGSMCLIVFKNAWKTAHRPRITLKLLKKCIRSLYFFGWPFSFLWYSHSSYWGGRWQLRAEHQVIMVGIECQTVCGQMSLLAGNKKGKNRLEYASVTNEKNVAATGVLTFSTERKCLPQFQGKPTIYINVCVFFCCCGEYVALSA